MELSLPMKLRIAASAAVGIILIGILAWPLAAPADPFTPVRFTNLTPFGAITLAALAFLAGLIGYFLSWPHGREIGILAVPAGLAVWAVRTGSMANLIQQNPTLPQRQQLFASLRFEPIFWLAIVAAGFAGVLVAQKIRSKTKPFATGKKHNSNSRKYLNPLIALAVSGFVAEFCIRIFAQDLKVFDSKLGSVSAQPAIGQVVFGVLVSFKIAAFLVKKFLNLSYIWPIAASALIMVFLSPLYLRHDILQYLVQYWPAVFFTRPVVAILPIQLVAFGTLGSIAGYWSAVRYTYWRKHEMS